MREIVVGFSETEESRDALRLGELLATAVGARLCLAIVYVVEPMMMRIGELDDPRRTYVERMRRLATETADPERYEIAEASAFSAQQGLDRIAEERGSDLIVVGSSHHGKLGRAIAGSVGESLLATAPCAVAVAPRGFAGEGGRALREVGVGWDGRAESRAALHEADRIATASDAALRVLTVVPPYTGFAGAVLDDEGLRAGYRSVSEAAGEELPDARDFTAELLEGGVAFELSRRAPELDLLIVGSRGYGPLRRAMIGSTSRELFRGAPCPVMVVPRPADAD